MIRPGTVLHSTYLGKHKKETKKRQDIIPAPVQHDLTAYKNITTCFILAKKALRFLHLPAQAGAQLQDGNKGTIVDQRQGGRNLTEGS